METPILGGFDVGRTKNLTDNLLVNMYMEAAQAPSSASGALYMTPGKRLFKTLGPGPIRGFEQMQNNLYTVSGSQVFCVFPNGLSQYLGSIGSISGPVSMITNGFQVAIFDSINGYVIDSGNALSLISLPFVGPVIASYQDGFGLVTQINSQVFWQSKNFDLSTWGPLNFTSADGSADNIVSIAELHREQWVFKTNHTEIYIDAGQAGFAFQRLDGVFPESGCAAKFSVARAGDSLVWLEQSSRGFGRVVRSNGYTIVPISTHSIDRIIQEIAASSTISDAVAYTYQEDGHVFYVISFPSGNATYAYDLTESENAKQPLWHQRAAFSQGQFNRDLGQSHIFYDSGLSPAVHLVGDYRSGNIYIQSLEIQLDNGQPRKWLRSWRALPKEVLEPVSFKSLEVVMQTGIGIAPDANPVMMFRWSDDDGFSWSNYRLKQCGPTGATAQRVKFNALGGTTRAGGQDRIFELSSTDPADWAILDGDVEASA